MRLMWQISRRGLEHASSHSSFIKGSEAGRSWQSLMVHVRPYSSLISFRFLATPPKQFRVLLGTEQSEKARTFCDAPRCQAPCEHVVAPSSVSCSPLLGRCKPDLTCQEDSCYSHRTTGEMLPAEMSSLEGKQPLSRAWAQKPHTNIMNSGLFLCCLKNRIRF